VKKAIEREYVEAMLAGLVGCSAIQECEKPDFWIRRLQPPDLAIEVTEYHPTADEAEGIRRVEIESRWRTFQLKLDSLRQQNPSLRGIELRIHFNDPRLPKQKVLDDLAIELIDMVADLVGNATPLPPEINVCFQEASFISKYGQVFSDYMFLSSERWPLCSRCLSTISMHVRDMLVWPPWWCPQLSMAWIGPSQAEFDRILSQKAEKAVAYDLRKFPLWLLVVCDLIGDPKSHLSLTYQDDIAELFKAIQGYGFDLATGPFNQVWLFSAFTRQRIRLHPV
jgi:hypothetical protein